MKLHHIGIAVRSLDEALGFYRDALGLTPAGREAVPSEGVTLAFLPVGGPRIELLEPLGPDSPVARFLGKRGEGIHHLCFEVGDLERSLASLRAAGASVIEPAIRAGAGGHRISFLHPRSTNGVLVELKEVKEGEAP